MLSLTRKTDYALVALAELARRAPQRISARKLAECVRVPLPVLANILHQLLNRGLVCSTRGPQGGYLLARDPDRISLAQVIDAIEGGFRLAVCCHDLSGCEQVERIEEYKCNLEEDCRIKEPLQWVHQSLRQFLSQLTLGQVAFHQVPIQIGLTMATERENQERTETMA